MQREFFEFVGSGVGFWSGGKITKQRKNGKKTRFCFLTRKKAGSWFDLSLRRSLHLCPKWSSAGGAYLCYWQKQAFNHLQMCQNHVKKHFDLLCAFFGGVYKKGQKKILHDFGKRHFLKCFFEGNFSPAPARAGSPQYLDKYPRILG